MAIARFASTYTGTDTAIVNLGGYDSALVSILISGNATVSVTNDADPDTTTLWSEVTLTNNACAAAGPITGVKFAHTGAGSYSIVVDARP